MKKETQTVWFSEKNRELMRLQPDGNIYIPLSTVNRDDARELGLALADYLGEPVLAATLNAQHRSNEK